MEQAARSFDAALLSGADAAVVVREVAAIENMAATVKALAAARVAETGAWKSSGDRSAAHYVARTSGSSVKQASDELAAAKHLGGLDATSHLARSGELSLQQASVIADAAALNPSAERELIDQVKRGASFNELRDECSRVRATSDDLEARRRKIHSSRYLRTYIDADGAWNLHMRDNPEVGARIMAQVNAVANGLFRKARKDGVRESEEAYKADALVEIIEGNGAGRTKKTGSDCKILVRVDLAALLRGYPTTGEVCEIAGYGPIAVSAVRDMVDSGDPFLAAIATKGKAVVGVVHLGRSPNAHQRSCLEWLYPNCAVEGCSANVRLEKDHRIDWSRSHQSLFDYLDRLCSHHHGLKTRENWELVEGSGKRQFVPPEDSRNPGHSRRAKPGRARAPAA